MKHEKMNYYLISISKLGICDLGEKTGNKEDGQEAIRTETAEKDGPC